MRRITGSFNNIEVTIVEDDSGSLDVPADFREHLVDPGGTAPMGAALVERCRLLFGDSMHVQDYLAGETPPSATQP